MRARLDAAVAMHDRVIADERIGLAAPDDHPALAHGALVRPLAGLDRVRLTGRGTKERFGKRSRTPVQHRWGGGDVGPRTQEIRSLAELGRDYKIPLRRRDFGQRSLD